jgi:hypothetical protein
MVKHSERIQRGEEDPTPQVHSTHNVNDANIAIERIVWRLLASVGWYFLAHLAIISFSLLEE